MFLDSTHFFPVLFFLNTNIFSCPLSTYTHPPIPHTTHRETHTRGALTFSVRYHSIFLPLIHSHILSVAQDSSFTFSMVPHPAFCSHLELTLPRPDSPKMTATPTPRTQYSLAVSCLDTVWPQLHRMTGVIQGWYPDSG